MLLILLTEEVFMSCIWSGFLNESLFNTSTSTWYGVVKDNNRHHIQT